MNATAIATGGSTAKQFDSGTLLVSGTGSSVTFNFTFINNPIVVCSIASTVSPNTITTYGTYSVTKSGFSIRGYYFYQPTNTAGSAGDTVNWVAIG